MFNQIVRFVKNDVYFVNFLPNENLEVACKIERATKLNREEAREIVDRLGHNWGELEILEIQ